jgi:sulfate transport system permease protein
VKTTQLTWGQFWTTVTDPVVVAAYRLSFQASLAAAADQQRVRA